MKIACTAALLIALLCACSTHAAPTPTGLPPRAAVITQAVPTAQAPEPKSTLPAPTQTAPVEALTLAPAGRLAISSANASNLHQVDRIGAYSGNDVVWSPDGKLLAISGGLSVDVYDPVTFMLLSSTETQYRPSGLLFHPNSAAILVVTQQLPGQVLDAATGATLDEGQLTPFCPPGEVLSAFAYWESRVFCVPEHLAGFPRSDSVSGAISMAYAPGGALALVGGGTGFQLFGFDDTGQPQMRWDSLAFAAEWGTAAVFSANGQNAALGFRSGRIVLVSTQTGDVLRDLQPGVFIQGLAFHPDGSQLAYVSQSGVGIIDLQGDDPVRELGSQSLGEVSSVALSPDGSMLAIANRAGDFYLWDRAKGEQTGAWDGLNFDEVYHPRGGCYMTGGVAAFSPDGRLLALGDNGRLRLVDTTTHAVFHMLDAGQVHAIAFSPDGRLVASGIAAGGRGRLEIKDGIRVWEVRSGKLLHTLEGVLDYDDFNDATQNCAVDIAFLDGGRVLASAGAKHMRFWYPASGQPVWMDAEPRLEYTQGMSTTASGEVVAAADYGGWFRLWALEDGNLESTPSVQWRVAADNLVLTRDGSAAITLGTAGDGFNWELRVSEAATGAAVQSILIAKTNKQLIASDLVLSADGSLLAIGFADGRVLIYGVE